jgi:hypothetical protein
MEQFITNAVQGNQGTYYQYKLNPDGSIGVNYYLNNGTPIDNQTFAYLNPSSDMNQIEQVYPEQIRASTANLQGAQTNTPTSVPQQSGQVLGVDSRSLGKYALLCSGTTQRHFIRC